MKKVQLAALFLFSEWHGISNDSYKRCRNGIMSFCRKGERLKGTRYPVPDIYRAALGVESGVFVLGLGCIFSRS